MNGAHALIQTLVDAEVDVCFANPGTSEMHFVAALDDVPGMRAVLGLFEGVVTGAADGYARMADKPACTLLHLGPGLGNGIANLHNARRAHVPVVNLVGDHATYHHQYDAPLQSDIDALAGNVSGWIRSASAPEDVAGDAADAVAAARRAPGQVATLILPADVSWGEGAEPVAARPIPARNRVEDEAVSTAAKAIRSGEPVVILLGGAATREDAVRVASRISQATGAKVLGEVFPTRITRGAGVPNLERLGYLAEFAVAQLQGTRHLVLVDAKPPASFFAYPGKPSSLVPDGCEVHTLATGPDDVVDALQRLAEAVGAGDTDALLAPASRSDRPTGPITAASVADALGALLPEGAIVADEAQTGGIYAMGATAGAPQHDWLTLTGGSIGFGMPIATGAAVACPDRSVINLQADGSAMYTLQSLWTQARENLDVTTIVYANRSYAILNLELSRVGVEHPGPSAFDMLDLTRPDLDFVQLARGMGVDAVRPADNEELVAAMERALAEPGPHLIEAVVPSGF
jgi:acetolactate synthase I/II/III large subunit